MWLKPGRAQLEHGHCTARSTVLAAPPAMGKDKSGKRGQTAVGLDPINEGVQPDVLQRGRAGVAHQRSIAERWIDSVVNVVRVNERIM